MPGYVPINRRVMNDTVEKYTTVPELKEAVWDSIARHELVKHDDVIAHSPVSRSRTQYIVSPKRSLEAAGFYRGRKVAILNFANNHDIGGDPFVYGAQEESHAGQL